MFLELLIGAGLSAFAFKVLLLPSLERRAIRALVVDRIAYLASVAKEDICFTVIDSYRVMHESKWTSGYRVNFSYRDLSTLVSGNRNPFVDIGTNVQLDEGTDKRRLEEQLAKRLLAWTARTESENTSKAYLRMEN